MFIVTFISAFILALFIPVKSSNVDYDLGIKLGHGYNIFSPHTANQKTGENKGECNKCGISLLQNTQNGRGRVINGRPVTPIYKYPWIVPLFKNGNDVMCGGALISATFVITAAHCVFRKNMENNTKCSRRKMHRTCFINTPELRVGLLGDKKSEFSKSVRVQKIIPHPAFSYKLQIFDLALIQLSEPVLCSGKTMPVCLPNENLTKAGQMLITAGWGSNSPEGLVGRQVLREGALKEVETKQCMKEYQPKGSDKSLLCAVGTETRQTNCKGDSGSALFGFFENKFHAVGVVSYRKGLKCGLKIPIAYAKVFTAKRWIKNHVKDLPKQ